MNWLVIAAGVIYALWPLQFRWSMSRIRRRLAERGRDPADIDRAMDRPFIRWAIRSAPFVGAVMIVFGVVGW